MVINLCDYSLFVVCFDAFALFAKGFPATKKKYVYCADRYHEQHYCVCVPFEVMLFIRKFPTLKSLWKMGID